MPKNKEPQLSALNRLALLKERRLYPKKQEPIPNISKVNSVHQLEKWVDIIEKRINGVVNSTTCKSYSNQKISELKLEVKHLSKCHKDFTTKVKLLRSVGIPDSAIKCEEDETEKELFMKNLYSGEAIETPVLRE